MKILISWIALSNDFKGNKINVTGPNYHFHKYHFGHDKHILISIKKTEPQLDFLINKLKLDFPEHNFEKKIIDIEALHDLRLVKTKIEQILFDLSDNEIDIFFSPGSSIMQLAWYICHTTLKLNTNLVQLLRPEHSKNTNFPDLLTIEVEHSDIPVSAMIKQKITGEKTKADDFLITKSIKPVYEKANKIAQTDNVSVIITGDTGTGKEHLARYIHEKSVRNKKSFEAVNCAGFSDNLLETRLFGYKKGAFTGAEKNEAGIFKTANGGTVFLDEIADITPYMQQVLLRVLQEKEIRPVGGKVENIDVRIIAATNKNLLELCKKGNFRADLYYRLAVVELYLPDLMHRGGNEKMKLVEFFLDKKQKQLKKSKRLVLSSELAEFIQKYPFPGNIRELENMIERFYVFCDRKVDLKDISLSFIKRSKELSLKLGDIEKSHIKKVLEIYKGNKKHTAKVLGIALNTLKNKLSKYDTLLSNTDT